ncbi:hypothetical protein [Pseudomonas sp. 1928-m]|uniref:hypothetical protein n=2 Tax=Pseudomonas sp. 1928-m TaxID=3033804 RepID=UPI0023E02FEC|nr:hypothetical protein [Pseudomonas sp. 1928-m]MDF3196036.1 hypothetical protein [Pseudomonas sp. 1928-m]
MLATLYIVTSYLYGLISGLALVALMKKNQSHTSNIKKWLIYIATSFSLILFAGVLGEINTKERPENTLIASSIFIVLIGFLCGLMFKKLNNKNML